MKTSEQVDKLVTALSKAKLEMKSIPMSGRNPFFKNAANPDGSKYSTFTDLFNGTNEALSKNGLALSQAPYVVEGGRISVVTTLFHNSGQWLQNSGVSLKPEKDTPQGYASALTYSKRQEAFAMLGLSGDPDDDGNEANGNSEPNNQIRTSIKGGEQKKEIPLFDSRDPHHINWLSNALKDKDFSDEIQCKILERLDSKAFTELSNIIKSISEG